MRGGCKLHHQAELLSTESRGPTQVTAPSAFCESALRNSPPFLLVSQRWRLKSTGERAKPHEQRAEQGARPTTPPTHKGDRAPDTLAVTPVPAGTNPGTSPSTGGSTHHSHFFVAPEGSTSLTKGSEIPTRNILCP